MQLVRLVLACVLICALAPTDSLAADLEQLMTDGRIPGLSIALIRDGEIVEVRGAGKRNASSDARVDDETIFDAASLSKPVFAYAILQLVDRGVLSLDTPLATHVPDFVPKDPRAAEVTVRHVLNHTTGLPNWRTAKYPLRTHFAPGERFSYSGEGFVWLQKVVEARTGQPLEAVMQRLVFRPLGMRRSSFVWQAGFDANYADAHDAEGALSPRSKRKPSVANAAYSLQTTARDYARFLQAVLSGTRLKLATARLWLEPHVHLRQHCYQCLAPDTPEADQRVAWGLGWGLERNRGTFFHWGDNGRFKTFAMGSVAERSAIVVLANGANGSSVMAGLVDQWFPGEHPAFVWLNVARFVPNDR